MIQRPIGFKGKMTDKFLTQNTVCGVKYFCTSCGKTALGLGDYKHNHKKECIYYKGSKEPSLQARN